MFWKKTTRQVGVLKAFNVQLIIYKDDDGFYYDVNVNENPKNGQICTEIEIVMNVYWEVDGRTEENSTIKGIQIRKDKRVRLLSSNSNLSMVRFEVKFVGERLGERNVILLPATWSKDK